LRRGYGELFDRFVSLAMPEPVFLQAAELRGRFGLRTPDASTSPAPSNIAATRCGRMTTV